MAEDTARRQQANAEVTVEAGTRTIRARAEIADPAERRRLYDVQAARYPMFADYERGTDRVIPVVILTPQD